MTFLKLLALAVLSGDGGQVHITHDKRGEAQPSVTQGVPDERGGPRIKNPSQWWELGLEQFLS